METFPILRSYIEEKIRARLNSWNELEEILEARDYSKGTMVARDTHPFPYEFFVVEGSIRSFLRGDNSQEVNVAFYDNGYIGSPYFTRNVNQKHVGNLQALTNCRLILFRAEKFAELIQSRTDIRTFAFNVVEEELKHRVLKETCFITQPAASRLEFFREHYPGLENKIPLHHIASYLGISPVSLSRLRSNS